MSRVLEFLEGAEVLCAESELQRDRIDDTQSRIWLEVAAWRELIADVVSLESRCHAMAAQCSSAGGPAR